MNDLAACWFISEHVTKGLHETCYEGDTTEPVGLLVESESMLTVKAEIWRAEKEQQRIPGGAGTGWLLIGQPPENDMFSWTKEHRSPVSSIVSKEPDPTSLHLSRACSMQPWKRNTPVPAHEGRHRGQRSG